MYVADAMPGKMHLQNTSGRNLDQFSKIQDIVGIILPEFHDRTKNAASETAPTAVSGNSGNSHNISAQRTERDT
jgi:hypothetical protein